MTDFEKFENVYVYVGDAVRWDSLPPKIADLGLVLKTIASSTSSAPSFSTLLTGLYPSSHGVHSFANQIPETISTIHDTQLDTIFVNSIQANPTATDPIYTIQNRDPLSGEFSFEDMSQPFAVIERGPGGHAPYDGIGDANTAYFNSIADSSITELREQYQDKVEKDADHFLQRLNELEDAGVREETLIIYTSDHGELLGEGGLLGHSGPMRPELVYVPTVFIGRSIESRMPSNRLFRHVDLLPTILDALGVEPSGRVFDGQSVMSDLMEPGLSIMKLPFAIDTRLGGELFYEGVWYRDGGHVFCRSSRAERTKILAGKLLKSPKRQYLWRHLPSAINSYLQAPSAFGECPPRSDAKKYLPTDYIPMTNLRLNDRERETLRDLGYLE